MLENDVQLIRRVLSGNDSAFATLVERHQKGIHALVWRKIGDFHYAEEITQDTFIQAYSKLTTLKDPNHFSGWLYVIASRLSLNWIQRHKPAMQSLEDTPVEEIEESSYKHYMTEKHQKEAAENRSEVVKELLETLPESERTVVTLHYLGEMTAKEIGKYLGVSVNTIKSRLRRGRERLRESEPLVREMLGGVQLSTDLTARVMQEVADINLTPPPGTGKPFIPWAALGAATAVIVLMLGVGNHYLARFQRPYSFEAHSEPKVEIVEAPIVLDFVSKPSTRRQLGRTAAPGKNSGTGAQISEVTLRANGQEDKLDFSTAQWTQGYGPPGGMVRDIFTTSQGNVYAMSLTGMYKLTSDATAWTRVNAAIPTDVLMPTVEHRGTLYIVSTDKIFASTDDGETWHPFCTRPTGRAVGFIIQAEQADRPQTIYLALRDEGIFRSTDAGMQWVPFNDGLLGERMTAMDAVENTLFAGTNHGLYRLDSGRWEPLPIGTDAVYSLMVFEKGLYVGMGPDLFHLSPIVLNKYQNPFRRDPQHISSLYYSADLGASWNDITPKNNLYPMAAVPAGITVLAVGETLLALGATPFHSTDGGKNWTNLGVDPMAFLHHYIPSVAVNKKTFYKVGAFGIHRTTDAGESWEFFMNGILGTRIRSLVAFNNRLYAYNGHEVFQSIDGGVSWKTIRMSGVQMMGKDETSEHKSKLGHIIPNSTGAELLVAGDILYLTFNTVSDPQIFGLSADSDMFIRIQDIPTLDSEALPSELKKGSQETQSTPLSEILSHSIEAQMREDTLTINHDVFYVEYKRGLFKWKLGDPQWTYTGLVDTGEVHDDDWTKGFELAVSGETVYVGKRDGKLFQSLDAGNSWRDVTPTLPLRFTRFKEIVFAGSTVYVATDKGVLISANGEYWQMITDTANKPTVINQLAVKGATVYGAGDTGVYRLDTRGQWEQISSEGIPDDVTSLAILNNRLYGVTERRGLCHIFLEPVY